MTTQYSTTSSAVSGNNTYPTLIPNAVPHRAAEDTGEYTTTTSTDAALAQELKRLELKATGKSIAGQITRLYGLVSLLLPNEQPTDRTGEELRQMAIELEHATEIIEATVKTLIAAIVEESGGVVKEMS